MSDYGEFDLEDAGKTLGVVVLGTFIVMGLSILFFFTLSFGTANLFVDALLSVFGQIETAHLTILGFTLFTLVAPVGYIWITYDPAFMGIDTAGVTFEPVLIASIITYLVAGFIVGLVAKKDWMKGFTAGLWTGISVYIATLVMTLIALFAVGIFMAGPRGLLITIIVVFMILVMSLPSILICGAAGMIGGKVYHKIFVDKYR